MLQSLKKKLSLPETEDLALDAPQLTAKRKEVLKSKGFLHRIYTEWYRLISESMPPGEGKIIEIGSGGGFMGEFIPDLITSDIFGCPGVEMTINACTKWPFAENELKAVFMVDVLHHLPDVQKFFHEASIAIRKNGVIAMIEPWVTPWSSFVYSRLHHEPFLPLTRQWSFSSQGPLSGANSALPWIVFKRDRVVFERRFPEWNISKIQCFMPFSYLLSGGISLYSIFPGKLYPMVRAAEKLSRLENKLGMFANILLKKER